MAEIRMWLRWVHAGKKSKWHIAEEGEEETLCGRQLGHTWYDVKHSRTQPVDTYGVCIHCWKMNERAARVAERLAA
jgi:hypothetical protein